MVISTNFWLMFHRSPILQAVTYCTAFVRNAIKESQLEYQKLLRV